MSTTNNDNFDVPSSAIPELQDFFGGDWNFAHNATFSDLPDGQVPSALVFSSDDGGNDSGSTKSPEMKSDMPRPPPRSPAIKTKPPNLYEALRRSQMIPQQMMMMSPLAGYSDAAYFGGMDWNTLDALSTNGGSGLFPSSPTLIMDPTAMMRMKRPRVSPYLGAVEPTTFVPGFNSIGGMGMFPVGVGRMRPAKVPLSPIPKTERSPSSKEDASGRTMPLVLPFSTTKTVGKPAQTPVKLMPAPADGPKQPSPEQALPNLEGNIEKNLLSFLEETRTLEWDNITVVELKRILRQYELNATGKKNDLIQRIVKIRNSYRHLEESSHPTPAKALEAKVEREVKKREESSPDTMGSDNGLTNGTHSTAVDALDSLFADALDLPSHELVFH
jgi:hypothetical protein